MTGTALQLVGRWCFSFGYFGGRKGNKELKSKWMDGRVSLILPVTLSRFVGDDISPPFSSSLSAILQTLHRLSLIGGDNLGVWVWDKLHLSLPFFFFKEFPLSSPRPFTFSPPPCARPRLTRWDGTYQCQNKQPHCVSREPSGHRQGAYFFETWIGYPFTREKGPAGIPYADGKHGWSGSKGGTASANCTKGTRRSVLSFKNREPERWCKKHLKKWEWSV